MIENLSVIVVFAVAILLALGAIFFLIKGKNKKSKTGFFEKSEELSVALTDRVREKRGKN